ncbi:hypothetical protein ACFWIZ_45755, partial [Streptomyces sp. NPDC127044]
MRWPRATTLFRAPAAAEGKTNAMPSTSTGPAGSSSPGNVYPDPSKLPPGAVAVSMPAFSLYLGCGGGIG